MNYRTYGHKQRMGETIKYYAILVPSTQKSNNTSVDNRNVTLLYVSGVYHHAYGA